MDTVTILRELWRLRRYVAAVAVLAVLAGMAVMYKLPGLQRRQYEVGVATAQILVDTPSSQVVAVAPRGSDTVGVQANLVSSLMVDGVIKAEIAQQAGLRPDQLVGVSSGDTQPSASGPTPVSAPSGAHAYVLTTQVMTDDAGDDLPIIQVGAQAPTRFAAAKLADAAIAGLRNYVQSQAAVERIPDANRLQITGLASQATTETRGPSNLIVLAIALVVFALGCVGVLAVQGLTRAWHAASARDHLGHRDLLVAGISSESREQSFDEVRHIPTLAPATAPAESEPEKFESDELPQVPTLTSGAAPDLSEEFESDEPPDGPRAAQHATRAVWIRAPVGSTAQERSS